MAIENDSIEVPSEIPEIPNSAELDAVSPGWKRWRNRILIAVIIVAIVGGLGFALSRREAEVPEEEEEILAQVAVRPFGELVGESHVQKVATIEPAVNVPLVARVGGRVTKIAASLGSEVTADQLIVAVDGDGVANPAQAQATSAAAALAAFDASQRAALASADTAIDLAQLAVDAAKAGKELSSDQVAKGREQADLSVRQAELALNDVLESDTRTDALERSAHLALEAAELAQDQATLAKQLTGRQTSDGLKQSEENLESARLAKNRLAADLTGQRATLSGQAASAREQVRLAQIVTPVDGQVTRLTVHRGDFVQPGQVIGEVTAFAGARLTVNVVTDVRSQLALGQEVPIVSGDQEFTGVVSQLADGPSAESALWQVEILIGSTPEIVQPGDLVTVQLPVGQALDAESVFIPLDAVTVRQDGVVLFTVDEDNTAAEHLVSVSGYTSDFVVGRIDLDETALVVVDGNRLLRSGDGVAIR